MTAPSVSYAIAVTSENAEAVCGMSWKWVLNFARANSVPVWRLSRKPIIPTAHLLAAMARAAEAAPALTEADELAALEARVTSRLLNRAKQY